MVVAKLLPLIIDFTCDAYIIMRFRRKLLIVLDIESISKGKKRKK